MNFERNKVYLDNRQTGVVSFPTHLILASRNNRLYKTVCKDYFPENIQLKIQLLNGTFEHSQTFSSFFLTVLTEVMTEQKNNKINEKGKINVTEHSEWRKRAGTVCLCVCVWVCLG